MQVDCSKCKHCYFHDVMWGEYWCKLKDVYVYSAHSLKERFRECDEFEDKNKR